MVVVVGKRKSREYQDTAPQQRLSEKKRREGLQGRETKGGKQTSEGEEGEGEGGIDRVISDRTFQPSRVIL